MSEYKKIKYLVSPLLFFTGIKSALDRDHFMSKAEGTWPLQHQKQETWTNRFTRNHGLIRAGRWCLGAASKIRAIHSPLLELAALTKGHTCRRTVFDAPYMTHVSVLQMCFDVKMNKPNSNCCLYWGQISLMRPACYRHAELKKGFLQDILILLQRKKARQSHSFCPFYASFSRVVALKQMNTLM